MAEVSTTRMSRADRRAQLLALGVAQVAAGSFDDLSLDGVAGAAGISRSLLFHYFPTRLDFVVAIAEEAARELLEVTEVEQGSNPVATVRRGLEAFVAHIEQRAASYVSLVRGTIGGEPALRAVSEATRATIAERVLDSLGELGVAPTPRLRLAVRGWVAYVEEVVVLWLGDRDVPRPELIGLLEQVLLAAVALDDAVLDRRRPSGDGRTLGP